MIAGITSPLSRAEQRADWELYMRGELARFYAAQGGRVPLWRDSDRARRMVRRFGDDPEIAVFAGPVHVMAPHWSDAFYRWVFESEESERMTFGEWRDQKVVLRTLQRASIRWGEYAHACRVARKATLFVGLLAFALSVAGVTLT